MREIPYVIKQYRLSSQNDDYHVPQKRYLLAFWLRFQEEKDEASTTFSSVMPDSH